MRGNFDYGDPVAGVAEAKCPMALVWGSRSRIYQDDTLARARTILPKATPFVQLPEAAHHLMVDQPLAYVAVLRALLASIK
jgi:pimeloyl-ACP methyl ester carboxylesterase